MIEKKINSLKIFFISNNFTPYSGGLVSSILAQISGLQAHGHEVILITYQFLDQHIDDPSYVIRIPTILRWNYRGNRMVIAYRPTKKIDELVRLHAPDIIHVHHPFLLGTAAAHVAEKYGIPLIFTHHTLYHEYVHYIPFIARFLKKITRRRVAEFANRCATIIAPSSAVKEFLIDDGVTKPIVCIPSPLQTEFLTKKPLIKTACATPVRLLYVGRFAEEKNIETLFNLLLMLGNSYTLTLVGYGPLFHELKSKAETKYKFAPYQILFVYKPKTKAELISEYAAADLFLFPSQTDTQGLVIAEAFSQSRPVIAFDGPGQRDAIKNGVNGFLCKNVLEMFEKIQDIAADQSLYQHLQLNAWNSSNEYRPKHITADLIAMYQKVL